MANSDPTQLLEQAIALKLSELDSVRVDLFAASFRDHGRPTQSAQIRVGWSRSTFKSLSRNALASTNEETAFFEVEVEVPDLRSHGAAMGYLRRSISLLDGFTPYTGIKPLQATQAGEPRFERVRGTWLYSALFSAVWTLVNGEMPDCELIADLPTETNVILKSLRAVPEDFTLTPSAEFKEEV